MNKKIEVPRLPGMNMFLYTFGAIGMSVVDRVMAGWAYYYYAPTEGLKGVVPLASPLVVSSIFFLGRFLDTFIDPGVAYYSDKCKSPRGRRMPFMLWGGLPLAVSMALLFFAPVRGMSVWNAVYFAVTLSFFYFMFSFYVCPYLGLLPELGRTPKDRMNLSSLQGFFTLAGTVIAMVGAPMLLAKFNYNYRIMAVIMAGVAMVAFYAPVIGVDEKKYCTPAPESHLSIVETILSTLKNKPFVIYLVGNLSFWFGFNIITSCVPYYVTGLLKLKEGDAMKYFAIALSVAFVCIPIVNFMTSRVCKRNIMIFALAMFMVLLPSIYFFGSKNLPIDPVMFSYIIIALIGIPLSTLFIVPNAIVADLTDYDEKFTGLRREAIYFGTQGFFLKITLGLSTFLMGLLFKFFGKSLDHPLGIQLTGIVGGVFALTGVIAFLFFPQDLVAHADKLLKSGKK